MNKQPKSIKIFRVISSIICVILVMILALNITVIIKGALSPNVPPSVFGVTGLVVRSGSMSGNAPDHIEVGDLIFAKSADASKLKPGTIISYIEPDNTIVTHRIVSVNEDGTYVTKGDANNSEDEMSVSPENIIGVYATRIPKIGDLAMFMQTPIGMICFIGIPLVLYVLLDVLLRMRYAKKEKKIQQEAQSENEKMKAEIERLRAMMNNKNTNDNN